MNEKNLINWNKVLANGGISFCTAAIAAIGAGVAEPNLTKVALGVALLQGLLAFFSEMKKETEGNGIKNFLSMAVL